MATSFQHALLNSSTTLTKPPTLKKSQKIYPLKTNKFPKKPIKTPSLKETCHHENLEEAFVSLSNHFTQNSPHSSLDQVYSSVLELCSTKNALSQGQQVHTHVIKSNSTHDSEFLNTKLVFMYGKCGSLVNAEKVFERMSKRSIFTWNAMIGAYVTNGELFGALELYSEMRVLDVPLDGRTFPCVLKACGGVKDLRCGREIHGLAIKMGFANNVFVVNSLVGMYAKCGDLDGTMLLFSTTSACRDVVSWNSIISTNAANGQSVEALRFFREMLEVGVAPSTYTFVAALQACDESSFVKLGMEIHAIVLKYGQHLDLYVANALVVMYTKCGKIGDAARIFMRLDEKDNISWNSMLSCFVQNGLYNDSLLFFREMQEAGKSPDQVSVISILSTSARLGNLLNGMEVHAYAIKNGLHSDFQVGNSLTDMYAKCSRMDYMNTVFERMPNKDFISWTTVIAGYAQNNSYLKALQLFQEVQREGLDADAMMIGSVLLACSGLKCITLVKEIHGYVLRRGLNDIVLQNTLMDVYGEFGDIHSASRVFESIEVKDIVSWTSMMSSYVHNGLANEALDLFLSLKDTGIEPDCIALVSALSAAASLSALRKGKEIHGFLFRKGFFLEGSAASSLVDMYARCGTLESSCKVFKLIRDKDLVLWTSMIYAYGMYGNGKEAINLCKRMEDEHLVPDHIAFLALLYACSHSGLVHEGIAIFEMMEHEYQLEPWPEHCACLVDLLGRANHLKEAFEFVNSMHMEPTAAVWCALLRACLVHGHKELGEFAAHKLLELDPENPGNYILVSNAFAAAGRWEDVEEVRMRMKGKGLRKDPGCSWIEVGNRVHTFIARDRSHPQSDEIYRKLAQITKKLECEGEYVAQTKFALHNVAEEEKANMLKEHSERLAVAYGLLTAAEGTPIRVTKNLRVCGDCHTFIKLVSKFSEREIIMRDANRFHHFVSGVCSCGDFW